ncbi:BnaA01g22270D [Brassica napus]|uniref:BnaA01g22270D protein n=1 Tax=Brassica napus TaxID=3708 RepID=A0A078GIW7_BRANA|nr:BnaA01g22270D [Brassica napus]
MGSTHCSTSMFSLRETLFSFLVSVQLRRRSEMNLLQNPSDSGRGVDGSEEDVGHLRQVKKLKTSDNMEVDLTQIPTVEASDREKKDTSGLAISESPTAGSSSKGKSLNLVDESYPCDLSVINGYDCLQTLCAVEDRYPVRSDPLRSGRTAV